MNLNKEILTKSIKLKDHPKGMPTESNFLLDIDTENIECLNVNEIIVKILHVSVDPYMRVRMNKNVPKGYFGPFQLMKPISGYCVVKVLKTFDDNQSLYKKDDILVGTFDWKEIQKVKYINKRTDIFKVDPNLEVPLSYYLSILGMPAWTAYFGFIDICQPKKDDVVVVSAASGSVGSIVGQLAKIFGCFVIGISGTEEIKEENIYDKVINYKDFKDTFSLQKEIQKNSPNGGVDIYFDNVGGYILDAAILSMNRYGRISYCGSITSYNATSGGGGSNNSEKDFGPRLNSVFVVRELMGKGFLVSSYMNRLSEANSNLVKWIKEGKIKVVETKEYGFENIPKGFLKLFTGEKIGKMVIDCTSSGCDGSENDMKCERNCKL
ncbi:hypothetical protein ABK040_003119 [Willaertia magna]